MCWRIWKPFRTHSRHFLISSLIQFIVSGEDTWETETFHRRFYLALNCCSLLLPSLPWETQFGLDPARTHAWVFDSLLFSLRDAASDLLDNWPSYLASLPSSADHLSCAGLANVCCFYLCWEFCGHSSALDGHYPYFVQKCKENLNFTLPKRLYCRLLRCAASCLFD